MRKNKKYKLTADDREAISLSRLGIDTSASHPLPPDFQGNPFQMLFRMIKVGECLWDNLTKIEQEIWTAWLNQKNPAQCQTEQTMFFEFCGERIAYSNYAERITVDLGPEDFFRQMKYFFALIFYSVAEGEKQLFDDGCSGKCEGFKSVYGRRPTYSEMANIQIRWLIKPEIKTYCLPVHSPRRRVATAVFCPIFDPRIIVPQNPIYPFR